MTIEELLEQCIQKNLNDFTISGLKKKNEELPVKIKVRPVAMKDKIEYQVSEFIGRKVFHKNYKKDELKKKITDCAALPFNLFGPSTKWNFSSLVSGLV